MTRDMGMRDVPKRVSGWSISTRGEFTFWGLSLQDVCGVFSPQQRQQPALIAVQ